MKTIKTINVKLYPNKHMKQVLDNLCDYRRYCWNQGLETWNQMYDLHCIDKSYKTPNERVVRNELVENKQDWQYKYSSRVLQQAVYDLGNAWQHFLNKSQFDWGKPKFKIQRDMYSAFLIMNINNDLESFDIDKCNNRFDNFKKLHDIEVNRLRGCKNLSSIAI